MVKVFSRDNLQLLLVIMIIIGAIIMSRMFSHARNLPEQEIAAAQLPVTVAALERGTHPVQIRTTGRVKPRGTVAITPQVSGRVEWVSDSLYGGGYLENNQVLFRIEAADYKNNVARDRAEVAKAQTALALEQAEADAAIAEWQAINDNVALPALVSRQPQIAQAEAELAAAKARLAQAELNLSRTKYRLPFDGRVMTSSLEAGEYILAGQAYGEIYNQDALEVVLSVPQSDLQWLRNLKTDDIAVQIVFENQAAETGQSTIAGKILRFGAVLDETTRFQEIIVKPIGDGDLLPGMLTQVVLHSAPVPDTWEIPATAIQARKIIWLVDENQTLVRVEPEIIATLPNSVIVRMTSDRSHVNVVTHAVSGGVEGTRVMVLNGAEGER